MRSEQELKDQIGKLPMGNLCFKMIGGKRRCYHQWTEDGRRHSKYVKPVDEPALRRAVERRKELERELTKLFKLEFSDGEFDMVVWDREKGTCRLYEIKHAQERNSRQVRHLTDVRKLGQVARLYGRVEERTVLYRGEDIRLKNGIRYRNVNEYLCEGGDAATL